MCFSGNGGKNTGSSSSNYGDLHLAKVASPPNKTLISQRISSLLFMIQLGSYNVIIPKHIIEDHYSGGIRQLRADLPKHVIHEDEYLYSIEGKYVTHVANANDELIKNGIDFNESKNRSDAFTVMAKEGIWWKVEWLVVVGDKAWFIADVEAPV